MVVDIDNISLDEKKTMTLRKYKVAQKFLLKAIPQRYIAHFFCVYLKPIYCIIYEVKLNCKGKESLR